MGQLMKDDDICIQSFLEMLNLRFAPRQEPVEGSVGGLDEVVQLQKDFDVFRRDRTFKQSAALLGLGGMMNSRARARWFLLLEDLRSYRSNHSSNADQDIVAALIKNLASPQPLPVHFTAHDSSDEARRMVLIGEGGQPVFYIRTDFLTVSLPMKAWDRSAATAR